MSIRVFVQHPSEPGKARPCKLLPATDQTMGLPSPVCGHCGEAVVGVWVGALCGHCGARVMGVSATTQEEAAQVETWLHNGMQLIIEAEQERKAQDEQLTGGKLPPDKSAKYQAMKERGVAAKHWLADFTAKYNAGKGQPA